MALALFVMGTAHTLLHMAFMSKMLLLAEAIVNGTKLVPNAVAEEEPTIEAYVRNQAYAQRSYASQLFYMPAGMVFGAIAVVIHLWSYAWRAGHRASIDVALRQRQSHLGQGPLSKSSCVSAESLKKLLDRLGNWSARAST